MFYVYEWFNLDTDEIFYVGKGTGRRYKVRKHNKFFNDYIKRNNCSSRIIKTFEKEQDAFSYEYVRVNELKEAGQCACNIYDGGFGGTTEWWTESLREKYSEKNVMKSKLQRERMSSNNPMKDKKTAMIVGAAHKRKVCVGDKVYGGLVEVADYYGVNPSAISFWIERGYSRDRKPCYYYGENKPDVVIRTHNTTGKKVVVDGISFDSVKAACEYIGVDRRRLQKAILENKPCNGHECKYGNQQPNRENPIKVSREAQRLMGEDGNQ